MILHSGLQQNFWSGGMLIYGVCVMVVNLVLLQMINNYTGYCELMIIMQVVTFWIVLYIESRNQIFD